MQFVGLLAAASCSSNHDLPQAYCFVIAFVYVRLSGTLGFGSRLVANCLELIFLGPFCEQSGIIMMAAHDESLDLD